MIMTPQEAGYLGYLASKDKCKDKHLEFVKQYETNPKLCKGCKTNLPFDKRKNIFCKRSCAATFNNQLNPSYINCHQISRKFSCKFCGSEVIHKNNKNFCSQTCHKRYSWQKKREEIEKQGEIFTKSSKAAKKYIKETRGYKCEICGIYNWLTQKLSLILDHIDGNPYNWKLNNLRLLCPNCDSLTPTYKGKNKGKGRHSRMQRYREGKSY